MINQSVGRAATVCKAPHPSNLPGPSDALPLPSYYCPECNVGVSTSREGFSYETWRFRHWFWHLSCKGVTK